MSNIPSWARVGAKVVCVDAAWSSIPPAHPLQQNGTYTIEMAFVRDKPILGCGVMFHLREAENPIEPGFGFAVERFRPLITQEDDIKAHFSALLDTPTPVEA